MNEDAKPRKFEENRINVDSKWNDSPNGSGSPLVCAPVNQRNSKRRKKELIK